MRRRRSCALAGRATLECVFSTCRRRPRRVPAARAPVVVYLANDDALMPRLVANLLSLRKLHDLMRSRNHWIDRFGARRLLAADLADPRWREFHPLDPPLNRISITGTATPPSRIVVSRAAWWYPRPT